MRAFYCLPTFINTRDTNKYDQDYTTVVFRHVSLMQSSILFYAHDSNNRPELKFTNVRILKVQSAQV